MPGDVDWIELTASPLDAGRAVAHVSTPAAGGIAVFLGTTREEQSAGGKPLVRLDYQAYDEFARRQLAELAARAREQWPEIQRIALLHRTGAVVPAEPSVLIAVSTPHRAQAFEACRWLIDTLKREAAIWKREVWADGTGAWVEGDG